MIPDTKVVELRSTLKLRAKQISEQEDLSIEGIGNLLIEAVLVIDQLREYAFQGDMDVQNLKNAVVEIQKERDGELQRANRYSEGLTKAMGEVERLQRELNDMEEDKTSYRQMVQHFLDEQ